ncbi:MAG: hypothetical protein ACR2RA_08485 [Geminicoccaceae bacterium]
MMPKNRMISPFSSTKSPKWPLTHPLRPSAFPTPRTGRRQPYDPISPVSTAPYRFSPATNPFLIAKKGRCEHRISANSQFSTALLALSIESTSHLPPECQKALADTVRQALRFDTGADIPRNIRRGITTNFPEILLIALLKATKA